MMSAVVLTGQGHAAGAPDLESRTPQAMDLSRIWSANEVDRLPLCAHFQDAFLDSSVNKVMQWRAHVNGPAGARVTLHRTEPLLCTSPDADGCSSRSYVLSGDLLDVGFVCGSWASVQYERWQKRKPNVTGWIETSRLTELRRGPVDKLTAANLYGKYDPLHPYDRSDPLVQAAAANDLTRLQSLIEGREENPNGLAKSGEPLAAAIATGHMQVAKLLLKAGANAQPKTADGHCINLFDIPPALDDAKLFEVLARANADLNCHTGAWQTTTLMTVSGLSRVQAWHWADDYRQPPRRMDPVPLVKQLLKAGADVNATDLAGRTALFYTLEDNNIDVAKILLDAGADPNIHLDGRGNAAGDDLAAQQGATPLMEALWWYSLTNDPTMTRLLLVYHANPNYRDTQTYDSECDQTTQGRCTFQGQTVLTRAAEEGYYGLVKVLLEHGANASLPRGDGALAVDIAREYDHARTAALIAKWVEKHRHQTARPR
jgi:uncharacterized protein